MNEMPSGDPMSTGGPARDRSTPAVVAISLLLVAVGFVAGAFVSRAFGQPASAAVVKPRAGVVPRPGLNPGGPFRPGGRVPGGGQVPWGGQVPGGGHRGSNLPMLPANGSVAVGTITSVKGNAVTVKTPSGQTVTVQVGDATTIRVVKSGTVGDLTTGSTIVVVGTRASDGTLQARAISEGGALPGLRGPFGSSSTGAGSSSAG